MSVRALPRLTQSRSGSTGSSAKSPDPGARSRLHCLPACELNKVMRLRSLFRHHLLPNPSLPGMALFQPPVGHVLFLCWPPISLLMHLSYTPPCNRLFTCLCPPPGTHRAGSLRPSCHFIPNSHPDSVEFSSSSINVYGPLIKRSSAEIPARFFWQEKVNPHPTELSTQQLLLTRGLQNYVRRLRLSPGEQRPVIGVKATTQSGSCSL